VNRSALLLFVLPCVLVAASMAAEQPFTPWLPAGSPL
jgi:hypothetical protein